MSAPCNISRAAQGDDACLTILDAMSPKQSRVRKLLEQGLQSHRAGDWDAAEAAYIKAAQADPLNPDALNLRGAVALSTNRVPLAVTLFRKATSLQSGNPGLWGNLGNALFAAGDNAGSEEAYRRAARLAPDNPDFAIGIANALAAAGNADAAREIFVATVARRPDRAVAWFGLAKLADEAGDAAQALDLYEHALKADAHYGYAHLNRGVVLQSRQRMEEAEQSYRRALACGAPREATFVNLISVLNVQGKFDAVEEAARAAIKEIPHCADIHQQWSAAYALQGRLNDALAPARQAVTLHPENVKTQMALAGLLMETGQAEQGRALLAQLRQAHPDDLHLAYIAGVSDLQSGHFDEGWKTFSHREVRRTKLESRPWLGDRLPQDLRNKSIHLIREQGLGDELFFLRFVPQLKRLGANISYVTNPKLYSILMRVEGIDRLIDESADPARDQPPTPSGSDVDMLIGDLPRALMRHADAHWNALPPPLALVARPDSVSAMRETLARLGPPPYLALTWRGGTAPDEQKGSSWALYKNIRLGALGESLQGLPFTLIAIQRKPLPSEIAQLSASAGAPVHDLCEVNDDLEAMLALLALVDEYVGVSNTNMHLRAGLNRGARVLVPRPSEWRWLTEGDASPWFPGFGVYRQGLDGTWTDALRGLRAHLLG